ncbi:uncharacterized protein LOC126979165 [Leptidea sinapis]|uniref:Uncharacterized protein n=1 Tax=Leptidea sinapis TaxID=189913 RepID=A0A5E4PLK9_9NEOP|nr:uncharacterized protein LOC126979165 [Leptidea sinapis]VVC86608.1 unnamed protein product [Leptidea sinapis]
MDSSWTNKTAIYRDLAVAQGRTPIDIEDPIACDEKPPREVIEEETEEEFFGVDGNYEYSDGPDIQTIQYLLKEVETNDEDCEIQALENTMSNVEPKIEENDHQYVPAKPELSKSQNKKPVTKILRNRNAAMASLIETYGEDSRCIENIEPDDETNINIDNAVKHKIIDSSDEVNKGLVLSMEGMFRKKPQLSQVSSVSEKVVQSKPESGNGVSEYFVPSKTANDYYEKFVERNNTPIEENSIWSIAQRKMLEIEEKRKKEKESAVTNMSLLKTVGSDAKGLEELFLAQHRHETCETCIVCEVLCEPSSTK